MKNHVFSLLLIASICISCSTTSSKDESQKISLPLEVGNYWVYSYKISSERNGDAFIKGSSVLEVIQDTLVNDTRWFKIGMPGPFDPPDNDPVIKYLSGYFANNNDGIYKRKSFKKDDEPYLFIPNPSSQTPLLNFSSDSLEYTIRSSVSSVGHFSSKEAYNYIFDYSGNIGDLIIEGLGGFIVQVSSTTGFEIFETIIGVECIGALCAEEDKTLGFVRIELTHATIN